jgi:hypothetical protein
MRRKDAGRRGLAWVTKNGARRPGIITHVNAAGDVWVHPTDGKPPVQLKVRLAQVERRTADDNQ